MQRLVLRLTRQRAASEDIVQDAFLRLLHMPDGQIITPEAWLARVARNLALNHLRRESRAGATLAAEDVASDRPGIEQVLISRQMLHRVLRAILDLPPRRREIFVMHRFQDLTYDQIAAQLGISRNTVMVQIVNALADLRQSLGADFFRRD